MLYQLSYLGKPERQGGARGMLNDQQATPGGR